MEKQLQEILERSGLTTEEMFWLFRFVVAAEELFLPFVQQVQSATKKSDAAAVKDLFIKLREVSNKLRSAAKQV